MAHIESLDHSLEFLNPSGSFIVPKYFIDHILHTNHPYTNVNCMISLDFIHISFETKPVIPTVYLESISPTEYCEDVIKSWLHCNKINGSFINGLG